MEWRLDVRWQDLLLARSASGKELKPEPILSCGFKFSQIQNGSEAEIIDHSRRRESCHIGIGINIRRSVVRCIAMLILIISLMRCHLFSLCNSSVLVSRSVTSTSSSYGISCRAFKDSNTGIPCRKHAISRTRAPVRAESQAPSTKQRAEPLYMPGSKSAQWLRWLHHIAKQVSLRDDRNGGRMLLVNFGVSFFHSSHSPSAFS